MNYYLNALLFMLGLPLGLLAQNDRPATFSDTRVINTHSVEVLPARKLELRIGHRFGDIAGDEGGWATLYGLENASDILIGFDYGLTDKLTAGFSRTKGAGDLRRLINSTLKYALIQQTTAGAPLSLTAVGTASISTMERRPESTGLNRFPEFSHRIVTNLEVLAARRFSDDLSWQFSTGIVHRNLVPNGEENNLFYVGTAGRFRLSKVVALLVDVTLPVNGTQSPFTDLEDSPYHLPLGAGIEFNTGGHIFQVNLTNASGIMSTDYIPYTRSDWSEGQFRFGFTINRRFNL